MKQGDILWFLQLLFFIFFREVSSSGSSPNVDSFSTNPVSISEDSASGISIAFVFASDNEGDPLTYSTDSQNPPSPSFTVDSSGIVRTPSGLDAETSTSFTIRFSVSDGTSSTLTEPLVVNILDVNDNAPQFINASSYTTSVYNTVADNTLVLTVSAEDPDSTDTVSFSIIGGNTQTPFAISATGQITVQNSANLNPGTYSLVIEARDGTNSANTSAVIICIDDPCSPNPCQNSGTCTLSGSGYTCSCPSTWVGENCETDNLCEPNPCENSGNCSLFGTTYNCTCPSDYSGTNCTIQESGTTETKEKSKWIYAVVGASISIVLAISLGFVVYYRIETNKKINEAFKNPDNVCNSKLSTSHRTRQSSVCPETLTEMKLQQKQCDGPT